MSEEKLPPEEITEEVDEIEDVTGCVNNLSAALFNLTSIEIDTLTKTGYDKVKRAKRLVLNSLMYYCECLVQPVDDPPATE